MNTAQLPAFSTPSMGAVCWTEMVSHRSYLIRFAQRKLHDPMLAEDLVHDVFEAVMSGCAAFSGRSALRSWLTGILKNKLVDLIRDRARYHEMDADAEDDESLQFECAAARPDELAEHRERLAQTLARIEQLPQGLRDAMQWRVLHDEATEVVCERLAISQDSLFVRLHRARKQLLN
jgi:RNA polymerase sigma-70 factor (ECF subfamily)